MKCVCPLKEPTSSKLTSNKFTLQPAGGEAKIQSYVRDSLLLIVFPPPQKKRTHIATVVAYVSPETMDCFKTLLLNKILHRT